MKLIGDEHVSPKIVREVNDIALTKKLFTLESIIGNTAYQATEDEDWIDKFAKDGGHGILSADRKMLKRPTLIKRITDHGMIGIFLPAEWANSKRPYQMSHILYWWAEIEAKFQSAAKGTAWFAPKGLGTGVFREHVIKAKAKRAKAG